MVSDTIKRCFFDGRLARKHLVKLREIAVRQDKRFMQMKKSAGSKTAASIDAAVKRGESTVGPLKAVRSACALGLVIGAGFLTGGAATSAILTAGAGASLTGIGSYQDKGKVGVASLEAGGALVSSFLGFTKGLETGAKVVLFTLSSANRGVVLAGISEAQNNSAVNGFHAASKKAFNGNPNFFSKQEISKALKDQTSMNQVNWSLNAPSRAGRGKNRSKSKRPKADHSIFHFQFSNGNVKGQTKTTDEDFIKKMVLRRTA